MRRVWRVILSSAAGWATGMAVSLLSYFMLSPSRLRHFASIDLLGTAFLGALWAAALALLILLLVTLRRSPSPATCALVAGVVLLAQTLWRAIHPWQYYGDFPVWMLERDFVNFLPSALASGLVFGIVARRLDPNSSFKPTPLRGAA